MKKNLYSFKIIEIKEVKGLKIYLLEVVNGYQVITKPMRGMSRVFDMNDNGLSEALSVFNFICQREAL